MTSRRALVWSRSNSNAAKRSEQIGCSEPVSRARSSRQRVREHPDDTQGVPASPVARLSAFQTGKGRQLPQLSSTRTMEDDLVRPRRGSHEYYAERVRRYWAERGYTVQVDIVRNSLRRFIVSDMVDGLPADWRADK